MPSGPQAKVFADADGAADAEAEPDAHISSEPEVEGGTFGDGLVTIDGVGAAVEKR